LHKFINQFFICHFVGLSLFVVLLKSDNFVSSFLLFGLLKICECFFSSQRCVKHLFVPRFLSMSLEISEFSFSLVMLNQLEVPLSVEHELLSVGFLVVFEFVSPLGSEHFLFLSFLLSVILSLIASFICLPGQDVHSFLYLFGVFNSFDPLTSCLLFGVEHPQFSINLFFYNLVLQFRFLIH